MKKIILILSLIITFPLSFIFAQEVEYLTHKPKKGDGIDRFLKRYDINRTKENIIIFKNLNEGKFYKGGMSLVKEYKLPIRIYEYNGKNIRTSIGSDDFDYALSIQQYNDRMTEKGIKSADYRIDKKLWLPLVSFENLEIGKIVGKKTKKQKKALKTNYPIFGKKYAKIKRISNKLAGSVFYIVGGHGGPDPGAVGNSNNHTLHEDEYAYDVSLRLARRLLLYGATVYIIVRDTNDGIRDKRYLEVSDKEYYLGGFRIDLNQKSRLAKRANIINELYRKNKKSFNNQYTIVTHVDSRYVDKRIDFFFYHKKGSQAGYDLTKTLLNTIEHKYRKAQPNRGYKGSISSRNLYMLNNTLTTTVYIEIGNIQNPLDQVRILEPNNRQAMANWLTDGLMKYIGNK